MSKGSSTQGDLSRIMGKVTADPRIERKIRIIFAVCAVLTGATAFFIADELFGLTTLTLITWVVWEVTHGAASRRVIHSSTGHVLRASHVWKGEVMSDALIPEGAAVTLSATQRATFNVPDLGFPQRYEILRPGQRGYLLTLSRGMTGTFSMGGKRKDVARFLADSEASTQFSSKSVGPGDWGVINLDGVGDHVLFFQFVENGAIASPGGRDIELLLPALGFSVVLHSLFLMLAFYFLPPEGHSAVFPGDPELVADYLVRKPQPPLPEEEPIAGIDDGEDKAEPTSTAGAEGKAGGEGEIERARAEDPDEGEPDEEIPKSVQKGLLTTRSRQEIKKVLNRGGFDEKLGNALARLQGPKNNGGLGGFGTGTGTGFGSGEDGTGTLLKGGKGGTGGGGNAVGDVVTQKAIKTGGKRPPRGIAGGKGLKEKTVKVSTGRPGGQLGGLTAAQINKVVFSRKNAIKTCYQRQLQRNPGLGGKIVIRWTINSSGKVTRARVSKTTMRNGRVEDCIVRQVLRMEFPKPSGGSKAIVNYPFVFAQQ